VNHVVGAAAVAAQLSPCGCVWCSPRVPLQPLVLALIEAPAAATLSPLMHSVAHMVVVAAGVQDGPSLCDEVCVWGEGVDVEGLWCVETLNFRPSRVRACVEQ